MNTLLPIQSEIVEKLKIFQKVVIDLDGSFFLFPDGNITFEILLFGGCKFLPEQTSDLAELDIIFAV